MRRLLRCVVLKNRRTDEGKAVRRLYGDNSGMCSFADRQLFPSSACWSNTVTGVDKDNLMLVEYDP